MTIPDPLNLGILVDECEECHRTRPGRWLDTDDGSGEWFTCYDCQPHNPDEE